MNATVRRCAAKNISVAGVPPFLPNYVIDGFGGFNPYGLRRKVISVSVQQGGLRRATVMYCLLQESLRAYQGT